MPRMLAFEGIVESSFRLTWTPRVRGVLAIRDGLARAAYGAVPNKLKFMGASQEMFGFSKSSRSKAPLPGEAPCLHRRQIRGSCVEDPAIGRDPCIIYKHAST